MLILAKEIPGNSNGLKSTGGFCLDPKPSASKLRKMI